MSGDSGSQQQTPTTSTVSQQTIPSELVPYYQNLMNRAQNASTTTYTPYGGQRIADFSNQQLQAQNLANNNTTNYQGNLQSANQQATLAGQQFPDADMSKYMNPYLQNTLNLQNADLTRNFNIAQNDRDAKAARSGAFGGGRGFLENGAASDALQRQQAMNTAQGYQNAWNTGLSQFNQDRTNAGQNAQLQTNLGQAAQNMNNTAISGLNQAGAAVQGQQQTSLNTAYQDFLNQRDWTKNQIGWQSDIVHGLNSTAHDVTQQNAATPPTGLSQLAQIGTAAAGVGKLLKDGGPVSLNKYADGGKVQHFEGGGKPESPDGTGYLSDDPDDSVFSRHAKRFGRAAVNTLSDTVVRPITAPYRAYQSIIGQPTVAAVKALSEPYVKTANGQWDVLPPAKTPNEVRAEASKTNLGDYGRDATDTAGIKATESTFTPKVTAPKAPTIKDAAKAEAKAPEATPTLASKEMWKPEELDLNGVKVDLPKDKEITDRDKGLALIEAAGSMEWDPQHPWTMNAIAKGLRGYSRGTLEREKQLQAENALQLQKFTAGEQAKTAMRDAMIKKHTAQLEDANALELTPTSKAKNSNYRAAAFESMQDGKYKQRMREVGIPEGTLRHLDSQSAAAGKLSGVAGVLDFFTSKGYTLDDAIDKTSELMGADAKAVRAANDVEKIENKKHSDLTTAIGHWDQNNKSLQEEDRKKFEIERRRETAKLAKRFGISEAEAIKRGYISDEGPLVSGVTRS